MITGIYEEGNTKVEFVYSPLFEMMAALHVFCDPAHHLYRGGWYERAEHELPQELAQSICLLGEETGMWLIPMDFLEWEGMESLSVPDALQQLQRTGLGRWNQVFREYGREIGSRKKKEILEVLARFYDLHFSGEFLFLEPFLRRILKRECVLCAQRGLAAEVDGLHERIKAAGDEIILYKNKEYHFLLNSLERIRIWGCTFLAPHLIMGSGKGYLALMLPVYAEERRGQVPKELIRCMNALGDETRLRILRELHKSPVSTQELAARLCFTQAGISKQLKLLMEAGLVTKKRQGRFMMYGMNHETVEFLQYRLYEYLG